MAQCLFFAVLLLFLVIEGHRNVNAEDHNFVPDMSMCSADTFSNGSIY